MTPLMAIFSTVACAQRGGTAPITSSALRLVAASICATRASVGGMIGKPSDQPCSSKKACASQRSSGISIRSAANTAVAIEPPFKNSHEILIRHSREGGNPGLLPANRRQRWIPACAGMTDLGMEYQNKKVSDSESADSTRNSKPETQNQSAKRPSPAPPRAQVEYRPADRTPRRPFHSLLRS